MSSSTQNDSNQAPAGVAIVEPPSEIRILIEKAARAVTDMGPERTARYEKMAMSYSVATGKEKLYSFLNCSDPSHAFYQKKVTECLAIYIADQDQPYLPPPLSKPPPPLKDFTVPQGITLKELGIIKLTAQFVALFGMRFWRHLVKKVIENPQFDFMKKTDSKFSFYNGLVIVYSRVLRLYARPDTVADFLSYYLQLVVELDKGEETAMIDLHAFVGGLDYFAHIEDVDYSAVMPPPQRLSMMMNLPTLRWSHKAPDALKTCEGTLFKDFTLKELAIMKLTAQFVARNGMYFRRALMLRVAMNPLFEFMFCRPGPDLSSMQDTELRFYVFQVLVNAYSCVLRPCKKLKTSDAFTPTLLTHFFSRLQLEKLEEGVETAMIDLHAFVCGLDYFAHTVHVVYNAIMEPPQCLLAMRNWLAQMHLVMRVRFPMKYWYSQCCPHSLLMPLGREKPAFTIPTGITFKEFSIMKLAAQFSVRHGDRFLFDLMKRVDTKPHFQFLMMEHRMFMFYEEMLSVYVRVLMPSKTEMRKSDACGATVDQAVREAFLHRLQFEKLEKGVEAAVNDLHAFMGGVDYLARMTDVDYSAVIKPPESLLAMRNGPAQMRPDMRVRLPKGYQHRLKFEQFGIIKLTALFVARFGMLFCRDLMKAVVKKPQFKFMEPTDISFSLYSGLVEAYSRVLKPCEEACPASVLEGFFHQLQLEKPETAVIDLHAFVEGVNCFAIMENVDYSAPPIPEEPEPKRPKL